MVFWSSISQQVFVKESFISHNTEYMIVGNFNIYLQKCISSILELFWLLKNSEIKMDFFKSRANKSKIKPKEAKIIHIEFVCDIQFQKFVLIYISYQSYFVWDYRLNIKYFIRGLLDKIRV